MSTVVVKVFYGKEAHRIAFPVDKITFGDLKNKIAVRIKKEPSNFALKYEDQENDRVTLTCDEDIRDAINVARELNASSLKIYVSDSSDPVDQDEFVLLQSADKSVELKREEPKPVVESQVSFEQLNADFQKMLEDKLNAEPKKPEPVVAAPVQVPVTPVVEEKSEPAPVVDEKQADASVHSDVTCDGCNASPITGVRFKCIVCHNFDLCSKCEEANVHDIKHPLLKIKVPRGDAAVSPVRGGRRANKCRRSFAKFVEDITIPDRSNCAPGEVKHKVWKLQNVGSQDWPAGYKLACISGEDVIDVNSREVALPVVPSGSEFEVKVQINVPKTPGRYVSNFKLVNADGEKFGPKVWLDFYVPEIDVSAKKVPVVEEAKAVEAKPAEVAKSAAEIKYQAQLEELASMGFTDIGLNVYLLDKFEGKSERVVHWLLDRARSN